MTRYDYAAFKLGPSTADKAFGYYTDYAVDEAWDFDHLTILDGVIYIIFRKESND